MKITMETRTTYIMFIETLTVGKLVKTVSVDTDSHDTHSHVQADFLTYSRLQKIQNNITIIFLKYCLQNTVFTLCGQRETLPDPAGQYQSVLLQSSMRSYRDLVSSLLSYFTLSDFFHSQTCRLQLMLIQVTSLETIRFHAAPSGSTKDF